MNLSVLSLSIKNLQEPDKTFQRECDQRFASFKEIVIETGQNFKLISQELQKEQDQTNKTIFVTLNGKYKGILSDVRQLMKNVAFTETCLTTYEKFLQDIKNWLDSNLIVNGQIERKYDNIAQDYNYEKKSKFLKETFDYFNSLQREVAKNTMSKTDLEGVLYYRYLINIQDRLDLLRLSIEQDIALPLVEKLDEIRSEIVDSYSEALIRLRNISLFFLDGTIKFEEKAKQMKVWLSPTPDPQVYFSRIKSFISFSF